MTKRMVRRRVWARAPLVVLLLATGSVALGAIPGQSDERGPDGTPLACNFHFRLEVVRGIQVGTDPTAVSTDCDNYHIYLAKNPSDPSTGVFTISQLGSEKLTYHLTDMPLDEPVLLLDPSRTATRVIARRRVDRIDFTVGRAPFSSPPPKALLPRTPAPRSAADTGGSRSAGAPLPASLAVGSWRTQGMILEVRADGRFEKVSNFSLGSFAFNDSGSYEVRGNQITFRGVFRKEWTCP